MAREVEPVREGAVEDKVTSEFGSAIEDKDGLGPDAWHNQDRESGERRVDDSSNRDRDGEGDPPFPPSNTTVFNLSSENGQPHAKWLADQLAGYSKWYFTNGVAYRVFGMVLQLSGTITGLAATILAAAPEYWQNQRHILFVDWHWAITILTAITTVLTGALGPILKFARDREDGRIEMVKLRQEMDVLKGKPSLATFNACRVAIGRIATIERSYGGSKAGGT